MARCLSHGGACEDGQWSPLAVSCGRSCPAFVSASWKSLAPQISQSSGEIMLGYAGKTSSLFALKFYLPSLVAMSGGHDK